MQTYPSTLFPIKGDVFESRSTAAYVNHVFLGNDFRRSGPTNPRSFGVAEPAGARASVRKRPNLPDTTSSASAIPFLRERSGDVSANDPRRTSGRVSKPPTAFRWATSKVNNRPPIRSPRCAPCMRYSDNHIARVRLGVGSDFPIECAPDFALARRVARASLRTKPCPGSSGRHVKPTPSPETT